MSTHRHAIECPPRARAAAVYLAVIACFAAEPAAAQMWDGRGTNDNWSLFTNWDPNALPVDGGDLIFGGATRLSNTNDLLTSVTSITFAATGKFGEASGAFILGGNSLGLSGSVTNNNNNASLQTINLPVTLLGTSWFEASSGDLRFGAVNLGASTLNVAGARTTTIAGAVTGSGTVVVTGFGSLALSSGANTYSGGTRVQNGTLSVSNAAALGSGSVTLGSASGQGTLQTTASLAIPNDIVLSSAGGGELSHSASGTLTVNGVISGAGTLNIRGSVALGGINTYTGTTTLTTQFLSDTLRFLNNASAAGSTINVGSLATLATDGNATIGALLGAGKVTLGAGTLTAGVKNASSTYSGVMSGPGSFVKAGSGTMTMSGTNTYSGGTAVNQGTLQISRNANLGAATGSLSFDGGRLRATDDVTMNRAISILAGGGTIDMSSGVTFDSSGALSGTGALTKTGSGVLSLSGSYGGYSGATTLAGGSMSASGEVLRGSTVTVNAGTTLTSIAASIGGLAGSGSVNLSANALTAGNNGSSTTFSGLISGGGSLVKDGGGTLTLSGPNLYTGSTTILAGTLNVTSGLAGTSGLDVRSGATLATNGFFGTSVNAQPGSTIAVQPGGVLVLSNINANSVGNLNAGNGVMVLPGVAMSGVASVDGGALITNSLNLGTTGGISGNGTVLASILGGAGATINASGASLTLGNASATGAISSYGGALNVGASRVTLLEGERFAGAATLLQGNVTIAGGVLSAPLGIELNGGSVGLATLSGYGIIQDGFINRGAVTGGSGAGMLTFSGAVSGPGSFLGNVQFAGSYSPGNSPASVILGNAQFGALDKLTMELGGTALGTGYDHLTFQQGGILGGTLDVALIYGFTPRAGASFDLFDGPLSGTFDLVDLPSLADGLVWDTSSLYTTGSLGVHSVAAVPEPETYAMLLAGLGLLGFVARRRAKWGQNNIS